MYKHLINLVTNGGEERNYIILNNDNNTIDTADKFFNTILNKNFISIKYVYIEENSDEPFLYKNTQIIIPNYIETTIADTDTGSFKWCFVDCVFNKSLEIASSSTESPSDYIEVNSDTISMITVDTSKVYRHTLQYIAEIDEEQYTNTVVVYTYNSQPYEGNNCSNLLDDLIISPLSFYLDSDYRLEYADFDQYPQVSSYDISENWENGEYTSYNLTVDNVSGMKKGDTDIPNDYNTGFTPGFSMEFLDNEYQPSDTVEEV